MKQQQCFAPIAYVSNLDLLFKNYFQKWSKYTMQCITSNKENQLHAEMPIHSSLIWENLS